MDDLQLFSSEGGFVMPDPDTIAALSSQDQERIAKLGEAAEISRAASDLVDQTERDLRDCIRRQSECEATMRGLPRGDAMQEWRANRGPAQ